MNEQGGYPMNYGYIAGYPISGYERMYHTHGGNWQDPGNCHSMPVHVAPCAGKHADYMAGILLVLFILLVIITRTFF